MIGRGRALCDTLSCLRYGLRASKEPEIVHRQYVVGDSPREIAREFGNFQQRYQGSPRKVLSFVLSPSVGDGNRLTNQDLGEVARRFLREMKLEGHQGVAIVHRDRAHVHLHLYVNRVSLMGGHEGNHYLNRRAALAAEKVARDLGLESAKGAIAEKLSASRTIRGEIKAIHDKVMHWERPQNFDQYLLALEKRQVRAIPYINARNELLGFRFLYRGQSFKGSEVDPGMAMGNLAKGLFFTREELRGINTGKQMDLRGRKVGLHYRLAKILALKALQLAKSAIREAGMEI